MKINTIYHGDSLQILKTLPDENIDCCVTSPPYWGLRNYGVDSQLGLEKTPEEYVAKMVEVFGEVKRVLKKEGVLFLNLGDTYSQTRWSNKEGTGSWSSKRLKEKNPVIDRDGCNLPSKNLVGIPWRVAFALQSDGWYLRQDIIWAKPNPMPESVTDRCTKAHEYIFLLVKSQKYYFDAEAIKEKIEINSPAIVRGDIIAPSLIIKEGAVFEGNCSMGDVANRKSRGSDKVIEFNKVAKAEEY